MRAEVQVRTTTRDERPTRTMDIRGRGAVRAGWLALLLGAAACGGTVEGGDKEASGVAPDTFTRVINVVVQELTPESFSEDIRLTGTVEAMQDVTVSAEESGVIRELLVEKGSSVRAGQPIARIDDRVLAPQVDQARAQAALARETWERRKRLYEEDKVGSELAYLEARYTAEEAQARLAALEERLARSVVRAPIEGILDDRFVEVGTMVSPGARVARIVDVDPVKVTAGVPERYAADVRPGAAVSVTFDVLAEPAFEGTIRYVGAAVNARNRTFPVEFTIPNPGGGIKPAMVANVSVVRRTVEGALVLPQDAVVRVSDGYVVFVVRSEGGAEVAESRPVTLGASQGNRVVVVDGLEAGDRLVVVGQKQVANGDRVRVVEER